MLVVNKTVAQSFTLFYYYLSIKLIVQIYSAHLDHPKNSKRIRTAKFPFSTSRYILQSHPLSQGRIVTFPSPESFLRILKARRDKNSIQLALKKVTPQLQNKLVWNTEFTTRKNSWTKEKKQYDWSAAKMHSLQKCFVKIIVLQLNCKKCIWVYSIKIKQNKINVPNQQDYPLPEVVKSIWLNPKTVTKKIKVFMDSAGTNSLTG